MSRGHLHRGFVAALVLASTAISTFVPSASAEFGPVQLVSKSANEQADEAVSPAISGNGDFVVFAGKLGGRPGLFRKDLRTGAIVLVAEIPGEEELRNAKPSISADGRYVAFTTKVAFDPKNDLQPGSSDVYVADLSAAPPTYQLVSALNGCDPATSATPCGLTYGEAEPGLFGAAAAGRVAISADGRSVAFLIRAASDLTSGDPEKFDTSAGQVAVRHLGTNETVLITQVRGATGPVPGGGGDPRSEGPAISGDGSTVAWVGSHLPEQVPMLADEEGAVRRLEEATGHESPEETEYHEPLWRRVPNPLEQDPPTRRIVGGGDPLAPGCPLGGTLAEAACQGPFPGLTKGRLFGEAIGRTEGLGWGIQTPELDRDGERVALVGNPDEDNDLYVVNMAAGLSRLQAVRRLTHWVNPIPGALNLESALGNPQFTPVLGPIRGAAISSDGERIAFTTVRQTYPLAPPTLVTPAPSGANQTPELFQADLRAETIERLLPRGGKQSWEGGGSFEGETPSYSENGLLLAFASKAFNLVEGDANEGSDAFVVESPPASAAGETAISKHPSVISVKPVWRMTASASSLRDGRVRLVVGLPGAGVVRAEAKARLGRRSKVRRIASAHAGAKGAGVQRLTLRLPRKLVSFAHRGGGLNAELDVNFAGSGGKPLSAALDVRFLVHKAGSRKGVKGQKR